MGIDGGKSEFRARKELFFLLILKHPSRNKTAREMREITYNGTYGSEIKIPVYINIKEKKSSKQRCIYIF